MIDELWGEFNRLNSCFERSNFSVALSYKNGILNQIIDTATDEELKRNMIVEQKGLSLFPSIFYYLSSLDDQEGINKLRNLVNQFEIQNKEDLGYYERRFKQTDNKFDKLWYGYIVWFTTRSFDILKETMGLTFEFLEKIVDRAENYMDIVDTLVFSFNIILLFQIGDDRYKTALKELCNKIIEQVKNDQSKCRYLIEPIKVLTKIDKLSEAKISELIFNLHKAANDLKTNFDGGFTVIVGLLEASIDLVDSLSSLDSDEKSRLKNIIREMIGSIYEQVAERKLQSGEDQIVAAYFYNIAANEYKKGGNISKYQESLRLSSKHTVFDQYTEVKVEIPILKIEGANEHELIDNLLKLYFENEKSIVDKQNVRTGVKSELNKHPISLAFSHQNFSPMGPSSRSYTESEKIIDSQTKSTIVTNIHLFEGLVSSAAIPLEANNRLTANGVRQYIDDLKVLDPNNSFLLSEGIRHHFAKDYIAAIHILIPQLESVLRRLLELRNFTYFKQKRDALMVKELGGY